MTRIDPDPDSEREDTPFSEEPSLSDPIPPKQGFKQWKRGCKQKDGETSYLPEYSADIGHCYDGYDML